VNDTLGHHNGDLLLQEVGRRLRATVRDSDTVARLGGDEFGVALGRVDHPSEAVAVAEKLRDTIRHPMTLAGVLLDVEASSGIAVFPGDGDDVESLLQRADVAMYVAKEEHSGVETYRSEHDEYSTARLALVAELRRAIDHGELVLYYQPKLDVATGSVVGVEALVRWEHPERGLLEPVEFIPTAEHTGLIRQLTRYVIAAALAQLRAWHDAGLDLTVAVNLSARDLLDLELPDRIAALLVQYDLPAERLSLEITESVLLEDPVRARVVVDRLAQMGVRLAIDDFGTGYSSLAYLERLPVDEIKIDKSFVLKMAVDENDAVIVRSIVDLGHNLGLRVVAEGVEETPVFSFLRELGCDLAQGYLLSRPLPAADIAGFVETTPSSAPRV
jgi:diguanylate cyclase (GGDEF)-like protein